MRIEKRGDVGIISFERPEAMNALNSTVLKEMEEAIDEFVQDGHIRVIIFTGIGKCFIAGADLHELTDLRGKDAEAFISNGVRLFRRIETSGIPTITAVNGACLGGGLEFALCTDFRIASEKAIFAFPEAGLGLVPGFSGTQRLPRLIGTSKAKEMLFTGKRIKAPEALSMGLVNRVVPHETLMDSALELAMSMVANSGRTIALIKKVVHEGMEMDMKSAMACETRVSAAVFGSEDQIEGCGAFLDRRKANFKQSIGDDMV